MQKIVVVKLADSRAINGVNDLLRDGWKVVRTYILNGYSTDRANHFPELHYVLEKAD